MTIEIVDFPIENGGSFHSYVNVYRRVFVIVLSADLFHHPILGAPELRPPEQSSDPGSSVWQGLGDLSGTAS